MDNIMDNIAPLKFRKTTCKKKTPWKHNPSVKILKMDFCHFLLVFLNSCRKTKRKWQKPKLQVHYQIHKDVLCKYNSEICIARQSLFYNFINRKANKAPP